uniref:Uncharacterized protein n=1 Tax=Tetraselmis sp. GSL018 TaxID=582737 RepID=A0A061RSD6_9CHLO
MARSPGGRLQAVISQDEALQRLIESKLNPQKKLPPIRDRLPSSPPSDRGGIFVKGSGLGRGGAISNSEGSISPQRRSTYTKMRPYKPVWNSFEGARTSHA